jgi:hypothetical protein
MIALRPFGSTANGTAVSSGACAPFAEDDLRAREVFGDGRIREDANRDRVAVLHFDAGRLLARRGIEEVLVSGTVPHPGDLLADGVLEQRWANRRASNRSTCWSANRRPNSWHSRKTFPPIFNTRKSPSVHSD